MKQYKSLDLAKFICAVLIVVLHTAPFASYSKILTFGFRNIITVIAVPFFFLASGFLAFKKIDALDSDKRRKYVLDYVRRLVVIYLVWSVIYFPFVVIKWVREGFDIGCVLEYVKDFFFEGSYSTIWFLPALITAVLAIYFLSFKLSYKTIFIIACAIYLFTLGGSSYYGLVTQIPIIEWIYGVYYSFFDTIKNGILFGLIFVSMGAMISEQEDKRGKELSAKKAFIPVVISAFVLAAEEFIIAYMGWNDRGVDTVISLIPFTYFFAEYVLSININISEAICLKMRKYSILMFLTQRIPLSIFSMFCANTIIVKNSLLYFFAVLASTILISFVIIRLSDKIKVIKYIY